MKRGLQSVDANLLPSEIINFISTSTVLLYKQLGWIQDFVLGRKVLNFFLNGLAMGERLDPPSDKKIYQTHRPHYIDKSRDI